MGLVFPFSLRRWRLDRWHRPFTMVVLPGSRLALGSTGISPALWAEGAALPRACSRRWALRPLQAFWSSCTWLGCRDRADCGPWPDSCDSQLIYRISWLPGPSTASLLLSSEALGLSGRTHTPVLCQDLGRCSYRFPYLLMEAALLRRTVAWRCG